MEEATITLSVEKFSQKLLNLQKFDEQINSMRNGLSAAATGWTLSCHTEGPIDLGIQYRYTATFELRKNHVSEVSFVGMQRKLESKLCDLAAKQRWQVRGEVETDEDGEEVESKLSVSVLETVVAEGLPELTEDVKEQYFGRIYDRDAHIRIIYDNLKLAVKTGLRTRHHVLLRGLPAAAKSELLLCFSEWLGDDIVCRVDASTMSKAGLEKFLLDKATNNTLPLVLLIEEIEKCDGANINSLLQVMDTRGRIQRTNARIGNVALDCRIVLWATCNDEKKLQGFADGAIWSRFSLKPVCKRPDEILMEKILNREVEEIDGKKEWVEPVMDFIFGEFKKYDPDNYNDPRIARSLLIGGDRLLDGSFLVDYRKANDMPEPQKVFGTASARKMLEEEERAADQREIEEALKKEGLGLEDEEEEFFVTA